MLVFSIPVAPRKHLVLFSVFASLALLLKASTVFLYFPVIVVWIYFVLKKEGKGKILSRFVLYCGIPVLCFIIWLIYVKILQHIYHSSVFLLGFRPPNNFSQFLTVMHIFISGFRNFYSIFSGLSILAGLLFLLFSEQKGKFIFNLIWIFCILSWLIFFWLFCTQAGHHSYYHVPFTFLVFVFFLSVFIALEQSLISRKLQTGILIGTITLFVINSFEVKNTFDRVAYHLDLAKPEWYSLSTKLPKMGMKPQDKLFSCEDPSMNISLYLMQHKGWNSMNDYWPSYIKKALMDCDYAVLSDSTLLKNPELAPHFGKKIGESGSLAVFRLTR